MAHTGRTPTLVLERVGKQFGKRTAVQDVRGRLDRPLIVALVGPNGAGKTTLIRMILGLEKPTSGRITLDERPVQSAYGSGRVTVGYMPQGEATYPELTPRQNATFFAKLHRVPRRERREQVEKALRIASLSDRADDRLHSLSGGMRRRVSLACALVHEPRLIVLDEPTVGVDPELRSSMWDAFRALRDQGSLILLSTHYLAEAERADFVLFMRNGQIIASGTPAALMRAAHASNLEDAFLATSGKEASS